MKFKVLAFFAICAILLFQGCDSKESSPKNKNTTKKNSTQIFKLKTSDGKIIKTIKTKNGLVFRGYEGKVISELSQGEAQELLDEGGFFSIDQTSKRVSSFTISLANGDLEALKEGRSGVVQGFEEAEKMWGGKLPDISYATQEKTLELIDKKIQELEESL